MGESSNPLEILKTFFGYSHFHEHQEEIIQELISGKDALVLMPTGGGKSLCFQIPAMIRSGIGIIISPLIALMQDQVDALRQLGIRADFVNSTLSPAGIRAVEQKMDSGACDLVYVAPERLTTERFLQLLKQKDLALFAIDEAHCVSQWGHDFRPEYLKLSILAEQFPKVPRIALTATADPVTRKEILSKLKLRNAKEFISSFDRPNISYQIILKQDPKKQLDMFLKAEHPREAGIVYCMTRKNVEKTAEWLSGKGYKALPYHAGLDSQMRLNHQRRFLEDDGIIIVATIAFGMGIDKPDVRFVVHMDLPKSIECYYQETGRAGRDGEKADALLLYSLADMVSVGKILEYSTGSEEFKRIQNQRLQSMLGLCETPDCRRKVLLNYFGESYAGPCGNCDNCNMEVNTWDGTIAAQKALSCVYRTGERFGAGYLIDVLLGKESERITKFRHDRISTFGIGKELSEREWKSIFRQLLAAGYLKVEMDSYGGFHLSDKCRPVLRKEQKVFFRKDPVANVKERNQLLKAGSRIAKETATVEDNLLWEKLRSLRAEIAKENGLPAYVVFHDKTLFEFVRRLPKSLVEMKAIHGVGQVKLKSYGRNFLDVILEHTTSPQTFRNSE